jgi:hypothetical protein
VTMVRMAPAGIVNIVVNGPRAVAVGDGTAAVDIGAVCIGVVTLAVLTVGEDMLNEDEYDENPGALELVADEAVALLDNVTPVALETVITADDETTGADGSAPFVAFEPTAVTVTLIPTVEGKVAMVFETIGDVVGAAVRVIKDVTFAATSPPTRAGPTGS